MRRLTLSFDNGPTPGVTEAVLDCLDRRALKATFFVVGQRLDDRDGRALMCRAHEAGHWIGNHSETHSTPLGRLDDARRAVAEVADAERRLDGVRHPDRFFRPFGGGGAIGQHLLTPAVVEHLQEQRHSLVLWNSVPRDWEDPEGWCDRACATVATQDWTLMVLHDLPTGAMAHLDRFLDAVQADGVEILQDMPPACVPLHRGRAVADLSPYVADDPKC